MLLLPETRSLISHITVFSNFGKRNPINHIKGHVS